MTLATNRLTEGVLVLADGAVFEGELVGARRRRRGDGEVVFNTSLCGYQEIVTDPSYAGQVITFTYPHIGNYGVNADDDESVRPFCRGVIVRDLARRPSNWRATGDLDAFLKRHGVPGHHRDRHPPPHPSPPRRGRAARRVRLRRGRACAPAAGRAVTTDGIDLVAEVTTAEPYTVGDDDAPFRVVAYDFGIKRTILRHLVAAGCRVEVVPASTTAADVIAREPDGVFLSNGPGDPAAVVGAADAVAELLGDVPVFGICLGHQIMGLALGATTTKLPFGHHGANHPVRHEATGRVEITSQNHNYVVQADTRARRCRRHPRQPQRRDGRGPAGPRHPGVQRAAPPRGEPGAARGRVPVRRVHRPHGRPRSTA